MVSVLNFINDTYYHLLAASSLLNQANYKINVENNAFKKSIYSYHLPTQLHLTPTVAANHGFPVVLIDKYSSSAYKSLG